MAMDKARDRKGISREISDRRQDMTKRLKDAQKVVNDKKIEAETAKMLHLSGTSEGASEVKKAVQQAAEATDREHQKQERDLQKEGIDKAQKAEAELKQRSDAVKQDLGQLQQAISKIDTKSAQSSMRTAEKGAEKDQSFLTDAEKEQRTDRVKTEGERDKQTQEIKAARISFRN
jgi:hypothetical protein